MVKHFYHEREYELLKWIYFIVQSRLRKYLSFSNELQRRSTLPVLDELRQIEYNNGLYRSNGGGRGERERERERENDS